MEAAAAAATSSADSRTVKLLSFDTLPTLPFSHGRPLDAQRGERLGPGVRGSRLGTADGAVARTPSRVSSAAGSRRGSPASPAVRPRLYSCPGPKSVAAHPGRSTPQPE